MLLETQKGIIQHYCLIYVCCCLFFCLFVCLFVGWMIVAAFVCLLLLCVFFAFSSVVHFFAVSVLSCPASSLSLSLSLFLFLLLYIYSLVLSYSLTLLLSLSVFCLLSVDLSLLVNIFGCLSLLLISCSIFKFILLVDLSLFVLLFWLGCSCFSCLSLLLSFLLLILLLLLFWFWSFELFLVHMPCGNFRVHISDMWNFRIGERFTLLGDILQTIFFRSFLGSILTTNAWKIGRPPAVGTWGRTQMGSDGFHRILTGFSLFSHVGVRLVPRKTHYFKGFWLDFNRILTGL